MDANGDHKNTSFRDHIATVDQSGKRVWIHPKKPKGKWFNRRVVFSVALLTLLFSGPFIRIGGEPLLMMNILERKFVIFGQIFWPQDFFIFAVAMVAMVVFIALFTVVFGRLFCGWVCPQTVFMELVFRRIEYWIDGDWKQQRALKKQPWNTEKILKRTAKHAAFIAVSLVIGNTFLAYIVGSDELISMVSAGPGAYMSTFVAITIFSLIFYAVFAWFREQVCTVVCPYGRLQGVLLDKKSIVVAYDYVRGEKRSLFRKNEDRSAAGKGDCIDCGHCVDVCPTGIDIRNGTQLECVNCTACIDACNHMMHNVGLPQGLIRYASEENIAEKKKFRFTGRMKAYSVVLTALLGLLTILLVTRTDISANITRAPGSTFNKMADGKYNNIYNIKIINKTARSLPLVLRVLEGKAEITIVGSPLHVEGSAETTGTFMLMMEKSDMTDMETPIIIGVFSDDELLYKEKTTFLGPI
jgi:cytochrome c oxidase accessory protein FixG